MGLVDTILDNTFTKKDFLHRFFVLKNFLEKVYYSGCYSGPDDDILDKLKTFLQEENVDPETSVALLSWNMEFYQSLIGDGFYEKLEELKSHILDRPVADLIVAPRLCLDNASDIFLMVRGIIGGNYLIDVSENEKISAGCYLNWSGRQYDFSLKQMFIRKRPDLKRSLSEFLS